MDDLIIPSKSEKENILQLKEVLKVAKENGLIIKFAKRNNRYEVKKVGQIDGPYKTFSAADFMKPWSNNSGTESSEREECGAHTLFDTGLMFTRQTKQNMIAMQ